MFIRIYFDEKPLFLCDKIDEIIEPYVHHDDAIFIDEFNQHTVKSMIHEMEQEKIHAGVFLHPHLEELKQAFFKKFKIIAAGGGLVKNESNEWLLIFRRGLWDLPKGKLDKGETLEDCAVREVSEETGLTAITLGEKIIVTYHTYHQGSKFILKESHWYAMTTEGNQKLIPQTEEDIHDIRWVNPADISQYTGNIFPSVKDVLEAGLAK